MKIDLNIGTKIWPWGSPNFSSGLAEDSLSVGLDIGAYSIKVVETQQTITGKVIRKLGYKELLVGGDAPKGEDPADGLALALKELWAKQAIMTRFVHLVISDPALYLRHIRVPRLAEKELAKAIRWQAEKYTPFPIEEAIVDFQWLREQARPVDNQQDIMLVAIERKAIDTYLAALNMARLVPFQIDVAPFAAAKALGACAGMPTDEGVALVDIGGKTTSVMILKGDELQMVRSVALGGESVTAALATGLNVAVVDAEKIKRDFSRVLKNHEKIEQQASIFSCVEPVLAELVNQINRTFAYCEETKISKVYICGGTAAMAGLEEYLSQRLGVGVERANPFKRFSLGGDLARDPKTVGQSCQFMAATGEII